MAEDAGAGQAANEYGTPVDASAEDGPGQSQNSGTRGEEKLNEAEQWVLRRWRPLMFLVIFAIALMVGFAYKSQADPGTETQNHKLVPPQTIHVYTSNPYMSVKVEVTVYPNLAGRYVLDKLKVIVTNAASHPGRLLITSNVRSRLTPHFSHLAHIEGDGVPESQRYYNEFPRPKGKGRGARFPSTTPYVYYSHFRLPDVLQENRGTVFGHLPSIEGPVAGEPAPYLAAQMNPRGYIRRIIYNPPSSQSTVPGALDPIMENLRGPIKYFDTPANMSISESIVGILPLLRTDQITYMNPPAKLQGTNYTWQANNELEAAFEATDPDASDTRTNASFTSGIALGVAGAAAIALVQELPREIPRPRKLARRFRALRLGPRVRSRKSRLKQMFELSKRKVTFWLRR